MAHSKLIITAVVASVTLMGCAFSGDSTPDSISVRSFVVARDNVEILTFQGREYQVQDITFEYDDGRRETRRYVIIGMRRIGCDGEDCQDALERGLADQDAGSDDY
jgi:uncharacterized lipoprotein NlpE involved in copper resistance